MDSAPIAKMIPAQEFAAPFRRKLSGQTFVLKYLC